MKKSANPAQSISQTRQAIAAVTAVALIAGFYFALAWVRRDITYWSRSLTFTYRTDTLEACARQAALHAEGISVLGVSGDEIALRVPQQEGATLKPTPTAQLARLVVYGHSASISQLGPASEEAVHASLVGLSGEFAQWCGSP